MTDLPAITISAAARPDPAKPLRAPDAANDLDRGQQTDGQFQQELAREMGALQGRTTMAKDARESAAPADRGKGGEDPGGTPESVGTVDASRAAAPTGASLLSETLPAMDAGASTAPAERGRMSGVRDKTQESAAIVDGASAAALTGACLIPAMPIGARPLPGAAESTPADARASTSAPVSPVAAMPSPATVRGAHAPSKVAARTDPDRADSTSVLAQSNPGGLEHASEKSRAEFALGPVSAPAGSAAAGRFLPAGPDALEPRTGLESKPAQRHAAETALPAGVNIATIAPAQVAHAAMAAIATHVAAPGWDRGLGDKMLWMAGQQIQVAELHLNPPELGPLQITLSVNNDQASAQFVSQHAAVREAIETAMPRLREMLAEGGITLGNTSVSADSFGAHTQGQYDSINRVPRGAELADTGGAFRVTQLLRAARGMVDIFA